MLVSIITPLHNAEQYIGFTIESVLKQTHQNWEMIIVDDNSSDNSISMVKNYDDDRIKLIQLHENHGPALTRNKAIEESKGTYISFLDADDLWTPTKLEKQLNFMTKHDLSFSYASYFLIDEQGNALGEFETSPTITYTSMLKTCSVGCLTAIYDAEKLGKIYMKNIPKGQDYTLWLEIMQQINETQGILEPLAYYRIQNTSVSSNKFNAIKAQWRIYRNIQNLNIFQSAYYFIHYAYYGFFKYR